MKRFLFYAIILTALAGAALGQSTPGYDPVLGALTSPPVQAGVRFWFPVSAGTLAQRPATCTANHDIYICNGTGCTNGNNIHYCRATDTWEVQGVAAGGGITNLNGLVGATQTFTNDTNVTFSSAGTAHAIVWSGVLSKARGGTANANGTADGITGGSSGQLPFQTGVGATGFSSGLAYNDTSKVLGLIGGFTAGQAGIATGTYKINGTTSGTITITGSADAGTWSLTLPTSAGSGSGLPILSGTPWTYGTLTGNTGQFATWSGATTAARCVHTDASGNLTISSADCNTGGSMTYPSGSGFAIVSGGASWGTTLADPLTSAHGGTGVNNGSATLTLGSSSQNWATLGTGIVKNTVTTGAITNAVAADVVGLWTTCTSGYLKYDGTCTTPGGGGTVTSSGTPLIHQLPVWTTATDAKGIAVGATDKPLVGVTAGDPAFSKLTLTNPATAATITVADGATLQQTGAFVLNLTATAASTPTFPAGTKTLVSTDGNVATATALAANGTNCSAGNYPLGVDASGNAESCTASSAGITVMTTGADNPVAPCTAPSTSNMASYTQTTLQEIWDCVATDIWKKRLMTTNIGTFVETGGSGTAPSRPTGTDVTCYFDSTSLTRVCLDAGTLTTTMVKVVASRTANQFVTHVPATGIPATAPIAAADLPAALANSTSVNGTAIPASATLPTIASTNTFTGRQDATGSASTAPVKDGTSVPGTCAVGDIFFKTDATAGQNLHFCTATNTYTQMTGGGGYTGCTADGSNGITCTGSMTALGFISDPTKSGGEYFKGVTSGGAAIAARSIAGTAITYYLPTTNGTAGQILSDSGAITCDANLPTGFPAVCHLMVWIAASTGTTTPSSTETFTNKTYDAEGTGNLITMPFTIWLPGAGCNNATAASFWDLPTATPAVATCVTGTNTQKGVLAYADTTGGFSAQNQYLLPSDWSGTVDARILWNTAATTGNAKWSLSTICTATDATETDDAAFNTASTVTTAAPGTTLRLQTSAITTVTVTGCTAGEFLHLKLFRDGNDGADTIAATANVVGVELKLRRAM